MTQHVHAEEIARVERSRIAFDVAAFQERWGRNVVDRGDAHNAKQLRGMSAFKNAVNSIIAVSIKIVVNVEVGVIV
jgi:hypothetical protein